jgi:hypothetical protein
MRSTDYLDNDYLDNYGGDVGCVAAAEFWVRIKEKGERREDAYLAAWAAPDFLDTVLDEDATGLTLANPRLSPLLCAAFRSHLHSTQRMASV